MPNEALFQMMRFNVLTFATTELGKRKLDDAYVTAWDDGVYPVLHDNGADWHKPFAANFRVNREMMENLTNDLDARWRGKRMPTFYQLETERCTPGSGWARSTLIDACTYLCLNKGTFDDTFRKTLLSQCPVEASSMAGPFNRDADLFLM